VRGVSESLAGRVAFVEVGGFDLRETGADQHQRLWLRGGLPRSYLAQSDRASLVWRDAYARTFLERDIPQLGISVPAATLRRFWTMVAHLHGQVWNASELARALGASEGTARRYLDILTSTYMVRQLQPWFENIGKRQVKAPKVYLRDSGLLHLLLDLGDLSALQGHPKLGASWEGFALEQVLRVVGVREAYFWGTHGGAELDLLLLVNGQRYGVEFKYADAPRITKSMRIAMADLGLKRLFIIYPGTQSYSMDSDIEAVSILDVPTLAARMAGDS
jgi:predicted AAA+ superfamily ATPase